MTINNTLQPMGANQYSPDTTGNLSRQAEPINARRTAVSVGILFIIGTAAGILSAVITGPVLGAADAVGEVSTNGNQLLSGAFLVLVMGISLAMVPVLMFPIFRKYNEGLALGSVIFRGALEAVTYMVMVTSWLLLIKIGQQYAFAPPSDASQLRVLGVFLLDLNGQITPIQEIVFSLGALMFYVLFYQSRLIPRWLSGWGVIGALVYLIAGFLTMSGLEVEYLLAPLAVQEMVLALWLIVKGFATSRNPGSAA
jgi:hypothetical protein